MGREGVASPAPADSFRATGPGDLAPFREVLADQEFRYADLARDAVKGAVTLVVRRKFPPRRGVWGLRILGVQEWSAERGGEKESDTLKEIRLDPSGSRVVLRCVLDEYTGVVDRIDLRLARLDADEAAVVRYEQLPDWFHREMREKQNQADAEEMRVAGASGRVRRIAFLAGTAAPLVLGILSGGHLLLLLATCIPLGGAPAWWLAGTRRSPQTAGPLWGLLATAACFGGGGWMGLFFTPLVLVSGGVLLFLWIRGEEDLTI